MLKKHTLYLKHQKNDRSGDLKKIIKKIHNTHIYYKINKMKERQTFSRLYIIYIYCIYEKKDIIYLIYI